MWFDQAEIAAPGWDLLQPDLQIRLGYARRRHNYDTNIFVRQIFIRHVREIEMKGQAIEQSGRWLLILVLSLIKQDQTKLGRRLH